MKTAYIYIYIYIYIPYYFSNTHFISCCVLKLKNAPLSFFPLLLNGNFLLKFVEKRVGGGVLWGFGAEGKKGEKSMKNEGFGNYVYIYIYIYTYEAIAF
jgi:hypothetical protein